MLNRICVVYREEHFYNKPGKPLIKYLRMISREIGLPNFQPHRMLVDTMPTSSMLVRLRLFLLFPLYRCVDCDFNLIFTLFSTQFRLR